MPVIDTDLEPIHDQIEATWLRFVVALNISGFFARVVEEHIGVIRHACCFLTHAARRERLLLHYNLE